MRTQAVPCERVPEDGVEGAAMRIGRWTRLLLAAVPLLPGFLAGCGDFWQAPSTTTPTCTTNCTTLSSDNFYILNGGTTSQVAGYSIVSGTLTALTNSPYSVTGAASAIPVAPTGSFLYVASTAGIYLYTINSSTGARPRGRGGIHVRGGRQRHGRHPRL